MKFEHLERTKEQFSKTANIQEDKGILKYGQPLNPLDKYDWLEMAEQEQVDGYKYLIAEQVKRTFVVNKIRKITDDVEVNHWLDVLKGK
ncbi:hypothetical protein AQ616_18950 [Oceanobacillus sp. E9]|uniref:hypothetical protein n=1 Tax=Oceanobacillus sp. E9 TaxID=1742575 RepID=UPI00084EA458|nr:hypothetical protein [Oceanobacillus sp. E9]OEH55917.1 hypothetical protein AQ616_18950 [Oceanobacillus sp. E9]